MMKLSQDDTCATVDATLSRRKKKKEKTSENSTSGSAVASPWFTSEDPEDNKSFLFWAGNADYMSGFYLVV